MRTVLCSSSFGTTINSPSVCAERRHIQKLIHIAKKKGIHKQNISKWMQSEVDLTIMRFLKNGEYATSFPCILCRQAMARYQIKWTAFHDGKWVSSEDENLPESKLTSRQRYVFSK